MTLEANRESRLRRALAKLGYRLSKRSGRFIIIDNAIDAAVSGSDPIPYSDSLDDVADFVSRHAA